MPSAEINVKFLNPKKPGKANASIKTDTDDFYLVPPELFDQFKEGGRYKVEYKESHFKGTTYKYVEKIDALAAPMAQYQRGKYGVSDDIIAERIFVSGILQRALAASANPLEMSEDVLVDEVNKLRAVWRRTFGNPQQSADLNDDIPY